MTIRKKINGGFTLLELSIVIIIIGLVISGVFVGRDLIHASELRATIAQFEKFKTASNVFREKYGCLAGDCPNATSFLSVGFDGDGNGKIGDFWADYEFFLFWQDLSAAGLINGNFAYSCGTQCLPSINYPSSKLGDNSGWGNLFIDYSNAGGGVGNGWAFPARYGNSLVLGGAWPDWTAFTPLNAGITGNDAYSIDSKIDDGKPGSGQVMGWGVSSKYGAKISYPALTVVSPCTSSDTASIAIYNLSGDTICGLIFPNALGY